MIKVFRVFVLNLYFTFSHYKVYHTQLYIYVGESAVGKSSLVLRFVKGQFHEYQESTIGGMMSLN